MYVYKITNNINQKCYIGISKNYKARWSTHKSAAFKETDPEYEKVLYKAFRKYGIENFTFELLFSGLEIQEAKEKECELISEIGTLVSQAGYNVTPGGDYAESGRSAGESNHNAKLTEQEVIDIITRREAGETQNSIYADYKDKVKRTGAFADIWFGRSWKYLQPATISKNSCGNRKLTDTQAMEVYNLALSGDMSYKDIGLKFGIPASTVSNIKNKKAYIDVTKKV